MGTEKTKKRTLDRLASHPGLVSGGILGAAALALLLVCLNPLELDSDMRGVGLNLATELVGIILTIGFVNFLLDQRRAKELTATTKPRAVKVQRKFDNLEDKYNRRLRGIWPESLWAYHVAVSEAAISAESLCWLVHTHKAALSALLLSFVDQANDHVAEVSDLHSRSLKNEDPIVLEGVLCEIRENGKDLIKKVNEIRPIIIKNYSLDETVRG